VQVDYARLSLAGNRSENQDRVDVFANDNALLMAVVDGMGGHAHGARAAEVTLNTLKECFADMSLPVFDPQGFLTLALARAHDRVVKLGDGVALDHKPRATCAVCLVQDGGTSATAASISCVAARLLPARAITATSSCCCARG
jgi:PPM family protein phosphatase